MTVRIDSISPNPVAANGGTKIEVVGEFPENLTLEAYIGPTGTSGDTSCYSGVPSKGIISSDGETATFVCPPLGKGIYLATVIDPSTSDQDTIAIALTEPHWHDKVFTMRKGCPPWYETGPRSLRLEKRL